ncbi:hypothetical protein BT93_G0597 [Corymbia citriodora subsp. variegata]|nr:hypothetical protein BT93_G0597 [Corymbia citriodora subsp. variegata]
MKDILVKILVKLIPDQRESVTEMTDCELFETLCKIQREKRCIVVLDDIWTKRAWDSLRSAFLIKDTRSKLLITTRNRKVAEYIDPFGLFHEPRHLSDQESWNLLKKRASLETEEITEDMKSLGQELLKKCGGLPSAIIMLGGLLAINDWKKVYGNINLHLTNKSDILKVSASSYDDLPWHLKSCFLYLGSFPKDVEIPATKVLHMWIAEGFVSSNAYDDEESEITVEDIAEQYLMELVNRGIVRVLFTSSDKIKTCRLHDWVQDLCVAKAREEKFLSILKAGQANQSTTRRLSVIDEENISKGVRQIAKSMVHLRTLLFLHYGRLFKARWEGFEPIFTGCKFLRVLKLEGIQSRRENLPESVGNLVNLRFLSLAASMFKGFPKSMGNLVRMEFLDLQVIDLFEVIVPNVLWKMRNLRHLHLPINFAADDLKKLRLDSLRHLQTLRNFYPKNCDVINLGKQTNLRKLTICNQYDGDEFDIIPQLAKFTLKHLQSSSFRFTTRGLFNESELSKMSHYPYSCKLSMKGKIEKLPKDLPLQLRKLILMKSQLKEDPMPILEKLHHLVVLILEDAFVEKEMVCSAGGFPQLNHLALINLQNLEEWRVAEGAMPHLSRLRISKCPKLKTKPKGVYEFEDFVDIGDEQEIDMTSFLSKVSISVLLIRRINVRDLVH